ncbi:hypothetical protein [Cytobacillus gottheilii]|uniref:hypothetical protein n=1 Tax=Cytobacillus gottheilii TaxID=859144 RepID=UPI0024957391|nr:hypothetical protein [Cytobacillus gottheilii]
MAKIKELIDVQSSYSEQVDIRRDYNNRSLKIDRMSKYRPIKSHRKAFEIIAEGLYSMNSKRCFILSGSYGTGKSHLLLMLANYFESQSDTDEMKEFFKNYSESEEEENDKKTEILRKVRKEKRFLTCVCNYGTNRFETYVLRALKEALERENLSEDQMDSYYLQAIRKINEWKEAEDNYFFTKLEDYLANNYPAWTINRLLEDLSEYNKDAIEVFKELHKAITTIEFQYDSDNYVQIIDQLSKSKEIQEKFAGIVILFDEFDYQLKGNRFDLDEFQKFAQMCSASLPSNFPIIFVATTHRSFVSYKSVYNSEDFLTVNDRVREIPMETEGIEEIISAIINPKKNSDLWQNEVKPRSSIFVKLASECSSQKIFDWLPAPKIKKRIIENIIPMHPMATYSLLKLASDVGSNHRSVFTFFASQEGIFGSYDWFVKNHNIIDTANELQLYTADLLFNYFKEKINSDSDELRSTVKEYVRNFETSMKELSKHRSTANSLELQDNLLDRILKLMIIYQIIGVDITFRVLKFGLNIHTQNDEKELEHSLKIACSKKIIYLNETNQCYEFRRSDALDINGLIKEFKQNEENIPQNVLGEIQNVIKNGEVKKISKFFRDEYFLEPSKYNFTYKEDKRLIRKFVLVKDITNPSYYQELLDDLENENNNKKNYEGIVLYVICENEDEIKNAKHYAALNKSSKIMVGVPVIEIPIFDEVFSLKAVTEIDKTDFSQQDLGILKEITNSYDSNLNNKLNQYIQSKNIILYGANGVELSNSSNDNDEAASKLLEGLYEEKRNKLAHEDLNKIHEFKDTRNTALKEAVEILLDYSKDLSFRRDYAADRGDIRYIQQVLLQAGVIKQIQTVGNQIVCELEEDTGKFAKVLPALADMIDEIKTFDMHVKPDGLIEDYMKTYGLGYNAALLFFAVIKRYFKDSLTIIPDANDIGSLKITSYDSMLDLLYSKKYKNAIMEFKELHEHDLFFIKELFKVFSNGDTLNISDISIQELYETMQEWYGNIESVNKVKSIYPNKKLDNFIDVFNSSSKYSARDFILEEIKTIYGYDRQDLVLEETVPSLIQGIKKDKELIENGFVIIRDKIIRSIMEIFSAKDETYDCILDSINHWYKGLSDVQKSYNNGLHNDVSSPLVMFLGKSQDIEDLFINKLPQAYNLGPVKGWNTDKSDSFVLKIKAGKEHIDENVFLVNSPEFSFKGKDIYENKLSETKYIIKYRGTLELKVSLGEEHNKLFITSNGQNPKDINSQRQEEIADFLYQTNEDKTIKFCAIDNEGKYSREISLQLNNEDNKFNLKYVTQAEQISWNNEETIKEDAKEYRVQVTLPKDEDSLKKCMKSLISESKTKYHIENEQYKKVLLALMEELMV